ncbi:hypothetical protein INS49_007339 [Diaporthe citri]|uniref:uncharacterized protein n=1 Tax=Diaporthe citri TaxID=83186 RepID=UPI001C824AF5|nr:uncharacterized protein INS49_007339 [Diaporthe citri]KAG6365728.1 hypothetical protein INS49_007339 [Diaporthe citri]
MPCGKKNVEQSWMSIDGHEVVLQSVPVSLRGDLRLWGLDPRSQKGIVEGGSKG